MDQSIIVKLRYRHVNDLSKTIKLLPDFIALANKYKWYNYRFILPRYSTDAVKHLNEIISDQVSQIEIKDEQNKTLDQSISHFKNLESIVVETSFSDSEEFLFNKLKSLSNVDIHIKSWSWTWSVGQSKIEFNRIGELIQNRRVISLGFGFFTFIGENDNSFQPNSLTKISLDRITMSQWMLKSLLENSLNCQNLEIENIVLNEDKNQYDKVLEILNHSSQSMNLQRLRVVSNITTSHQIVVDFLSNIKTGTLILVSLKWNNETLSDNITNQLIHSLELFTTNNDRILELWKHKDNIKSIFAPNENTVKVKEFKNLRYLTLHDLSSSMRINDISVHKNLHTVDFYELDFGVLNQLLSIPHPNIQRYSILSPSQ
ncbi:hypothetical protein DLAC_05562 [Tieghemostelium lacteum]|uniref:Uncharacterized protein n=1 Tax=Tieghemostelium lacteum TaxID=361077 RepID=A0A151ZG62_TIELA|nr:hypothetical protein DLAC_05562 [Tieghemostelium lacteum]|eukprot:KYQ92961.1 hypothetical protein DLAC_05562 [Tieghemostelium lacteum]